MNLSIKDILSIVLPVVVPILGAVLVATWWLASKFTKIDSRLENIEKILSKHKHQWQYMGNGVVIEKDGKKYLAIVSKNIVFEVLNPEAVNEGKTLKLKPTNLVLTDLQKA